MKKLLALLAVVLAVVSCQKEINGLPVDSNGEAAVSLSVALPEGATRAAGADSALGAIDNGLDMGVYDIRFILEVYDMSGAAPELAKDRMVKCGNETTATFNFRLVPGRDYNFVVWADFVLNDSEADLHYDTNVNGLGLRAVAIKDWTAIDESRDAYTESVRVYNYNGTSKIGENGVITLTRPFAKLRVVTNDIKEMISIRPSVVKVNYFSTKFYTAFDALYENPIDQTYNGHTLTVNLAEDFYANEKPEETGEQTLFADYFFAQEGDRVMFTMDVETNHGPAIPQVTFNTNIPVKRNNLTTVYGPILTDANNVTVTIDPAFENQLNPKDPPYYVEHKEAGSAEQLVEIFEDIEDATGETHIVLTGNIDLDDLLNVGILSTRANDSKLPIVIKNGKTVVLDLGGNTLTATDTTEKNFSIFDNRGTFTVKNSTIKMEATVNSGWNRYSAVLANNPGGVLTVDGVNLEHLGGTDMAYGIDNLTNGKGTSAITTIQNSTVKSPYRAVRQFLNGVEAANELYVKAGAILEGENKSIFFHDPSKNANTGKLVVEEGAILNGDVYLFVTAGSTEWPVEVSIAESAVKNEVLTGNVPAGYDVYVKDGKWVVEYGVEVNGDNVTILNAGGLKWLAAQVNSGNNYFAGKTIKLGADIDLNDEEWTPIGSAYADHGFMGNFDGNGYTIKNLAITEIAADADGYVYAGLFGVTEGTDKDNQNYIKNLVIENVNIDTEGHIVAAAIAYPYYTKLENIKVQGNVSIKGGDYTAGVLAYTRRCVDAENISIEATNGSIEGNMTVGGVISDIQMNGGLTANYSNFEATGLTIKGAKCVGGISGIIGKQTLDGATVKNVVIVSDDARKGTHCGSFDGVCTINNAVVENVTGADFFIGGLYEGTESTTDSVTINDVTYTYNNGWLVDGYKVLADGLLKKDNEYKVTNAAGLVALSGMTINGKEIVTLGADIDLTGVTFNGLNAFNPEQNNTFDGNGYTVSNWTNNSGASDMGFIKNWVGPIKNVKFDNCHLKTSGRSAIVAAKVYGNIENVEVKNSSIEDSYWACGIIAGLYNNGNISKCTVMDSSVKSNGGTAAIVGVINETSGERNVTNCSVTGCTINNTGAYGASYSGGALVGMFNCDNTAYTIVGCTVSNNTLVGAHLYEKYPANENVTEK